MKTTSVHNRLKKLGKASQRPSAYIAYLANDYDGIGQYTLVTLSRGSTAGALRAKVSAGAFGTGQIIPEGTPVTIFAYRGQLEILSLGAK